MNSNSGGNRLQMVDFLALGMKDAVDALRALLRAKRVVFRPASACIDAILPTLTAIGLVIGDPIVPATERLGLAVRRCAAAPGAATDLVTVTIDLFDASGTLLGILEVHHVSADFDSRENLRGIDALRLLMERQVQALLAGPALIAAPFLRLVTMLQDLDDSAVSHALGGLLRVLAGGVPNRVEAIAMQISGLANSSQSRLDPQEIQLSEAAQEILKHAGISMGSVSVITLDTVEKAPLQNNLTPPPALAPFARLRLAEEDFEVAEAEETGHYWFRRAQGQDADWLPLANRSADGWTAISAEILSQTRDTRLEYARMHVLRIRDEPLDEIAEVYELNEISWFVRKTANGYDAKLADGEWVSVVIEPGASQSARAIAALFQLDGLISARLDDAARDWVNRMAHSVQVMPCMSSAA